MRTNRKKHAHHQRRHFEITDFGVASTLPTAVIRKELAVRFQTADVSFLKCCF
ncbi:MAG TPA: hypothetical protein VEM15_13515 [Thermodesulfobacteriota bacterium]|nr:hypothetical protein [Thermodesulfobacteriota bacterium]